MNKPYLQHIRSSEDLVTSYEATRAGFVALALEKNRRATPFVAEARALRSAALQARTPADLLNMAEIRKGLFIAAGISNKAAANLQETDKTEAVEGLIAKYLEPAGENFVEELVYRFLLTRGDALGGSMRNPGGSLALRKLTRSLLAYLKLGGKPYRWMRNDARNWNWSEMPKDDTDIELNFRGLSWENGPASRTLIYNVTVPFLGNSVDLCLFDCASSNCSKEIFKKPESYIALGELKGGIDPAGADEHWKTARSELERIRHAFTANNLTRHAFFIGAAVERKMAAEIWEMLESGALENAANLTVDAQIASISRWLCSL